MYLYKYIYLYIPSPQQVRKLTKLGDATDKPQLMLLDIPDDGGFYVHEGAVDAASMAAFLAAYKAGSLTRQQLS